MGNHPTIGTDVRSLHGCTVPAVNLPASSPSCSSLADDALHQLARYLPSRDAAAHVLDEAQRLVDCFGHPTAWQNPLNKDTCDAQALAQSARALVDQLEAPENQALLQCLPPGALAATCHLLDDVITAVSRVVAESQRQRRPTAWAGRAAIPVGVRAFHALLVDALEQQGVRRGSGFKSPMVRAVDLLTARFGIRSSVRDSLRPPRRGVIPLMALGLAKTFLNGPCLNESKASLAAVPGAGHGLSAPGPSRRAA